MPLGAGDGRSHRLHHRHLGVDLGARLGDDHRRHLAAQHGVRAFKLSRIILRFLVPDPHRCKESENRAMNVYLNVLVYKVNSRHKSQRGETLYSCKWTMTTSSAASSLSNTFWLILNTSWWYISTMMCYWGRVSHFLLLKTERLLY